MRVIIVTPGHPSPRRKSFPPALTAPYLAALISPYTTDIKIYDLAVEKISPQAPVPDIAMFTTTMAQSDHIFELARTMKDRGVKIFLGGSYVTLAYEFDPRISKIADCVVLGEGEKAIPAAMEDYMRGELRPLYSIPISSLEGIPFSRLDLLDGRKYYSSTVLIGTRGCIHKCAYCSIRDMYGQKYLKRPVHEVIEEIKFQTSRPGLRWMDRKLLQFWDDNPAGDLDWFHDLLEKMIPLKKWWLSQVCLNVADNEETVNLMKASGCKGIFVGLESVSKQVIMAQNKDMVNIVEKYKRQLKTLLDNGICVVGAMMFGFDEDTEDTLFRHTLPVLEEIGLTLLQDLIFTPYPHLECFKSLEAEGRIITKEAKYYNAYTVVHRPKHIHPADLQQGVIDFRKKFYSWRSILTRMMKHNPFKFIEFIVWNRLWGARNYEVVPGVDLSRWLAHLREL